MNIDKIEQHFSACRDLDADSIESRSADFRSVIDDLTVENMRLRKRLRRYERLHCHHLESEKLFEIRVQRLPPAKKRKLEKSLRSFAAYGPDTANIADLQAQARSTPPGKVPTDYKSSSTSTVFNDSAYASMSMSGRTSHSHPHAIHKIPPPQADTSSTNSNTACPSHVTLSEQAKSKLVVTRLEQLFMGTGRGSPVEAHSKWPPCRAGGFNQMKGYAVPSEGTREALIIPSDTANYGNMSFCTQPEAQHDLTTFGTSGNMLLDQRPTRPVDLDPNRAQSASENIEYIKHLGLAAPVASFDDSSSGVGDGWVYFNLLFNMAQLHTSNVTPKFVRRAVAENSAKFELSRDGKMIRWKGNNTNGKSSRFPERSSKIDCPFADELDRNINDGGQPVPPQDDSIENVEPPFLDDDRLALSIMSLVDTSSIEDEKVAKVNHRPVDHRLSYHPVFIHSVKSDDGELKYLESDNSCLPSSDAMSHTSFAIPISSSQASGAGTGPIIFFEGANFCTDLSGDIGIMPEFDSNDRCIDEGVLGHIRGGKAVSPLSTSALRTLGSDLDSSGFSYNSSSDENALLWSSDDDGGSLPRCDQSPVQPSPFQVPGNGVIRSQDHFMIKVNRQRTPCLSSQSDLSKIPKFLHRLRSILETKTQKEAHTIGVRYDISAITLTNVQHTSLLPSCFLRHMTSDSDGEGFSENLLNSARQRIGCTEPHYTEPKLDFQQHMP
ncbi:hypothetical protein MMC25_007957 [Agyrium rufum]|nr:hypothetical protein [Agyrium rufum]